MYKRQLTCKNQSRKRIFEINVTNVGGAPAFEVSLHWEDVGEDDQKGLIVGPGRTVQIKRKLSMSENVIQYLLVRYASVIGIAVEAKYKCTEIGGAVLDSKRKYRRTDQISVEIEGD